MPEVVDDEAASVTIHMNEVAASLPTKEASTEISPRLFHRKYNADCPANLSMDALFPSALIFLHSRDIAPVGLVYGFYMVSDSYAGRFGLVFHSVPSGMKYLVLVP